MTPNVEMTGKDTSDIRGRTSIAATGSDPPHPAGDPGEPTGSGNYATALWPLTLGLASLSFIPSLLDAVGVERVALVFLLALLAATLETVVGWVQDRRCGFGGRPATAHAVLLLWGLLPGLFAVLLLACRLLPGDLGWVPGAVAALSLGPVATMAGALGLMAGVGAVFRERFSRRSLAVLLAGAVWLGVGLEYGRIELDLTWEGAARRQCSSWLLRVDRAVKEYVTSGRSPQLPGAFDAACDRLVAAGYLKGTSVHMNDSQAWPGVSRFWRLATTGSVCVVHGGAVEPAPAPVPGWRRLRLALLGRRPGW
ncbi:MAG: hypothetical protein HY815_06645 [Candidatus Riflebacteria bacterium]|nr:hypothetical protein [Candidatus Riflebacteria bacterium]